MTEPWLERSPNPDWLPAPAPGAIEEGRLESPSTGRVKLQGRARAEEPEISAAAALRGVVWTPVYCPRCRSRNCVTTGTPGKPPGLRYQSCRACSCRFKSFEAKPRWTWALCRAEREPLHLP